MRLLATVHIFQEVAPNVFANNRISSVMDSGKTLEEIKAKDDKYVVLCSTLIFITHMLAEVYLITNIALETLE